ncbi:MAG TPA: hypothetical protein VM120_07125 [Bryobacteraceae bacterium]|nr:hypothetical protein [Bryobacteraceae bacterium]
MARKKATKVVRVIMSKDEHGTVRKDAEAQNLSVSGYMRKAVGLPVRDRGGVRKGAGRPPKDKTAAGE